MRRCGYEAAEMYALIDTSNQMFEDSAFDMEAKSTARRPGSSQSRKAPPPGSLRNECTR